LGALVASWRRPPQDQLVSPVPARVFLKQASDIEPANMQVVSQLLQRRTAATTPCDISECAFLRLYELDGAVCSYYSGGPFIKL
jgi:hypothetical protein